MGETTIKSLEKIDNNGVMHAWEVFAEKKQRFTDIGLEIRGVHKAIKSAWGGQAYEEYSDQFANIFSQVEDIGDALTQIADAIKEVIYDGFYVADDSLNQQLLEAQHNTRKGSSEGSGGETNYTALAPKEVLYSTIEAAYIPNLAYPQLPARPVLVSTIGRAYQPNLAYHTMVSKPVLASCLPSARVIDIVYRNLPHRAVLSSLIGDALQVDIGYVELAMREQLASTISDMYVPDLSYVPLAIRAMGASSLSQCHAFLLDYLAASPNLQQVKNTLMATQVNQIVLMSLVNNRTDAETASLIGEAIVGNIHGEIDESSREKLVSVIGDSVFQKMYGRAPGETGTGKPVDWVDTTAEKTNLGIIRDTVSTIVHPVQKTFQQNITYTHPASGSSSVLTVQTGVGAVKTTAGIITPRPEIGAVSSEKVVAAVGQLAAAGNCRTLETCIYQAAAQKTGASLQVSAGATNQNVSRNLIDIVAGTSPVAADTINSVITGDLSPAARGNISDIVSRWSAHAGQYDFSSLRYPVPTGSFSWVI